jgi:transcriptional regulator with XRE-family HTH domain
MKHRIGWRTDTVRIDRERILRGLSQEQLARAAQVDPGTISDMLNGRRRPQLGTVGAIARALELALPDLVAFD